MQSANNHLSAVRQRYFRVDTVKELIEIVDRLSKYCCFY